MIEFSLALAFDTDDTQFVRGVEVGRLWEMFRIDDEPFEQEIHATNAEMVLRMGEATEREVHTEDIDATWLLLKVGPRESPQ